MRTRVVQAFSGNNSGTYVLVGTFREAHRAEALAGELAEVFAQQASWIAQSDAERAPSTPMHAYARAQGIEADEQVGAWDEWPTYGTPPRALATDGQLLVFVDYAVTFPRFLGELVYKRGGRVSVELNHSHEPIVIVHSIWLDGGWRDPEAAARVLDAFRADVEAGALGLDPHPDPPKRRGPPILRGGFWPGMMELVHAPVDIATAVRRVGEVAASHGLRTRFSLFESAARGDDPLRGLRAHTDVRGAHQVILWKPSTTVADTVRAVRSVTGLGLAEATELVARAPIEIVKDVSEHDAKAALDALRAVGADAELLGPEHFRE